jgi:hypothetical protein
MRVTLLVTQNPIVLACSELDMEGVPKTHIFGIRTVLLSEIVSRIFT